MGMAPDYPGCCQSVKTVRGALQPYLARLRGFNLFDYVLNHVLPVEASYDLVRVLAKGKEVLKAITPGPLSFDLFHICGIGAGKVYHII
jgi:hypothetical protein